MAFDIRQVAAGLILSTGLITQTGHAVGVNDMAGSFQQALEAAGWRAERRADGTVELRARPGTSVGREEEAETGSATPTAEPLEADAASKVWDRLRERGWRVESASDGSTLLYPSGPVEGHAPPAEAQSGEPLPAPDKGLDAYLGERGWRVEKMRDGSMLLYPRSASTPLAPKASPKPCAGIVTEPVRDGEIALPVDRWEEAKAIAESWLTSVDTQGSAVGRIRQVFRVYLVSIVEDTPPHRLNHQIAINAEDGRVMVLN